MLELKLKQLSELDKALKELDKKAKEAGKTKACLFNIVIDVEKPSRLSYYQKVISELIDNFPPRVFLVNFDETIPSPEVTVSLLSPKSAPHIVCDLIQIKLKTSDYPILFSLINAHFVSDLPIFYLPTEHSDHLSDFTCHMAKVASRVICDSTDITNLEAFMQNINKLSALLTEVSDLNWARIESWREIIAKNLHDDVLKELELIEIYYNQKTLQDKQYPMQAILLKGFLTLRLEEKMHKKVTCRLKPLHEESIWQGAILSVVFKSSKKFHQSFTRSLTNPVEAVIHFESPLECYLPSYVQFTKTESGQSLIKEIRHTSVSDDYLKIIHNLKSFL